MLKNSYLFFVLIVLIGAGCNQTQPDTKAETATGKTRDIVMTINLKDDSAAIAKYKEYHAAPWPELTKANEAAGIQKVKIYLQGRRLVMILTVPENWDEAKANEAYAAADPKVKEWGEMMAPFQEPVPEAKPGQSWVPMELVYDYEEKNK